MAAVDPAAFVRSTPPFDALPQPLFDAAAPSLDVVSHPAGTRLARAGGEPLAHLHVVVEGSVRLERDGRILQILEQGETFGYTSLISGRAAIDVLVEEDLVACRLPAAEFHRLLDDARFAAHFAAGFSERLKASLEPAPVAALQPGFSLEVQHLVRRPAVWVDRSATAGAAAGVMRRERISSVLVRDDPPGIVTDRDLRNRVLAERRGPATPVAEILSRPLRTVAAATPLYEAWKTLLDTGVHHLPVTRDGEVVGVVTSGDLLRSSAEGPVALLRRVQGFASRAELPGYREKVAEMASALLAGGLDAAVIAGLVSRVDEALGRRVLGWAEADLGETPAPFAWLVFGPQARREPGLGETQESALVYSEEGGGRREWFQRFAERVGADLEAAGFPPSPRGLVARDWHGPLPAWLRQVVEAGGERPRGVALLLDHRRAGGRLDTGAVEAAAVEAAGRPDWLQQLAAGALRLRPPPAVALWLRGAAGAAVDVDRDGLAPVAALARCYALEIGSRARGTLDRLQAAEQAGLMDTGIHASVTEAYRFLLALRLRQHLRLVLEGRPPSSEISLPELAALERSRARRAFRDIRSWQAKAAFHHRVGL